VDAAAVRPLNAASDITPKGLPIIPHGVFWADARPSVVLAAAGGPVTRAACAFRPRAPKGVRRTEQLARRAVVAGPVARTALLRTAGYVRQTGVQRVKLSARGRACSRRAAIARGVERTPVRCAWRRRGTGHWTAATASAAILVLGAGARRAPVYRPSVPYHY
jgi:hypothetical protein